MKPFYEIVEFYLCLDNSTNRVDLNLTKNGS